MRRWNTVVGLLVVLGAGWAVADPTPSAPDAAALAVQVDEEAYSLEQMQEWLKVLESHVARLRAGRANLAFLSALRTNKLLADAPADVRTPNLRVERAISDEKGLLYTVSAQNVPVREILDAVAKTSGLRLDFHPDIGEEHLSQRIRVELQDADMMELLEIVTGAQSLEVRVDKNGIFVAPIAALSETSVGERLRELGLEAYHRALVRYPASPQVPSAYLAIARYYRDTGLYSAAIQTAEHAMERCSNSSVARQAMLFMAKCYDAADRRETARNVRYRYCDEYPSAENVPFVMVKIAQSWIAEKKWPQALQVLEEVLRRWPKSDAAPVARVHMAECFMAQNQYGRAVEELNRVARGGELSPKSDEVEMMVARCLVKLKRYGTARTRLERVIRTCSSADLAERASYVLGDVFLAQDDGLAALAVYRSAMKNFPNGTLREAAPLFICKAYMNIGLYTKLEETLQSLPDSVLALGDARPVMLGLARHYLDQGAHQKALELIADKRWPHDQGTEPEILAIQARALLMADQPRKALEKAAAAADLAKDDAWRTEAYRLIGECRRRMKEFAPAAVAFGEREK